MRKLWKQITGGWLLLFWTGLLAAQTERSLLQGKLIPAPPADSLPAGITV